MCKYCDNIIDYYDLSKDEPYLLRDEPLPFDDKINVEYKIIVPIHLGGEKYSFDVEWIKYCPFCGKKIDG